MTRVGLIGAGVVGSSWALVFARAGLEVTVHDADPAFAARLPGFVRRATAWCSGRFCILRPSTRSAPPSVPRGPKRP